MTEQAAGYGDHEPVSRSDLLEPADELAANEVLCLASLALSTIGFLTLLRLADRRDRSPAKALSLFLATTTESTLGTALGVMAIDRNRGASPTSRGFLMAAAGTVLGVVTTVLTFNWMRTKRRL